MENAFNLIDFAQNNILKMHEGLTIQQLNKVPDGFSNNLIWNYAHAVATVQMLCYLRGGLPIRLNEEFVHKYKIGTKPEAFVQVEEYNSYKQFAIDGLEKLKEDYKNNVFADWKPFTTATGVQMNSIDFALRYVGHHFGVHQGATVMIRKFL